MKEARARWFRRLRTIPTARVVARRTGPALMIAVQARVDAPGYGPRTVKAGIPDVQPPIPVPERVLAARMHLDESDAARPPRLRRPTAARWSGLV